MPTHPSHHQTLILTAFSVLTAAACAQAQPQFNILDYGATPDAQTLNTAAIAKAITAATNAGGGRVLVPPGAFLTGPIQLKSNVDLHLADGATLLFTPDIAAYPDAAYQSEEEHRPQRTSPLWADNAHDLSITGPGALDGNGQAWRPVKKSKVTDALWTDLIKSNKGAVNHDTWFPTRPDAEPAHDAFRPSLVLLSNCRRVTLDGPTFRNSPGWNVHLLLSENITVRNVTLFNPPWAQNGDSLDIDSCRNVSVTNSSLAGGDDVICLKSGKDQAGRRRARPTENIFIANCTLGSGHGGITVGSEMSGGVRNLTVTNCAMNGTNAGLRFKTTRGRGGIVENISITNIEMHDIQESAIDFNMYYGSKNPTPATQPATEATPQFRQIHIANIHCTGAKTALDLRGLPEMPLDAVTLENARLTADHAGSLTDCTNLTLRNVRIQSPAPATVHNVHNLTLDHTQGIEQTQKDPS